MRHVKIDQVVRDICSLVGDPSGSKFYVPVLRVFMSSLEYLKIFSIPTVVSRRFVVENNLTVLMPKDTFEPIFVGKIIGSNTVTPCMYPLTKGQSNRPDVIYPSATFGCDETSEVDIEDRNICFCFENFDATNKAEVFFYQPNYFGERYGDPNNVVFGIWEYEKDQNLVVFGHGLCINPGDVVAVSYFLLPKEAGDQLIPVEARMIVMYHTLMNYFSASNPSKSRHFLDLFQRAERDYRKKANRVPAQTIIDAFLSTYKSSV